MAVPRSRGVLSRLWLPALVVVVVVVAGFTIKAAHGVFGSQDRTHSPGNKSSIVQVNPKPLDYEIFGDFDGWGRVSYWDVNSKPVEVDLTALPWKHQETTVLTTATADITAQVAGGNIGCRITV